MNKHHRHLIVLAESKWNRGVDGILSTTMNKARQAKAVRSAIPAHVENQCKLCVPIRAGFLRFTVASKEAVQHGNLKLR